MLFLKPCFHHRRQFTGIVGIGGNKIDTVQLLGRNAVLISQRMTNRQHHHQRFMKQLDRFNILAVNGVAHQSDIQFAAAQLLFLLGRDKARQLNMGIRPAQTQHRQHLWQQVHFGGGDKTNRQMVIALRRLPGAQLGLFRVIQNSLCILQKALAGDR